VLLLSGGAVVFSTASPAGVATTHSDDSMRLMLLCHEGCQTCSNPAGANAKQRSISCTSCPVARWRGAYRRATLIKAHPSNATGTCVFGEITMTERREDDREAARHRKWCLTNHAKYKAQTYFVQRGTRQQREGFGMWKRYMCDDEVISSKPNNPKRFYSLHPQIQCQVTHKTVKYHARLGGKVRDATLPLVGAMECKKQRSFQRDNLQGMKIQAKRHFYNFTCELSKEVVCEPTDPTYVKTDDEVAMRLMKDWMSESARGGQYAIPTTCKRTSSVKTIFTGCSGVLHKPGHRAYSMAESSKGTHNGQFPNARLIESCAAYSNPDKAYAQCQTLLMQY